MIDWHWKRRFAKEVLAPTNERIGVALSSSVKYSTILEMDRKIRDFYLDHFRRPTIDPVMGEWKKNELMQYETNMLFMEVCGYQWSLQVPS